MDAFLATMQQVLDYLHTIKITDLIDIAIISYLFYRIILFAKETRAGQVLRGIGLVIFLLWIANVFNLHILAYILPGRGGGIPAGDPALSGKNGQRKPPPDQPQHRAAQL